METYRRIHGTGRTRGETLQVPKGGGKGAGPERALARDARCKECVTMSRSTEYKNADKFKRYLMREINAGKNLLKRGFTKDELPADVHTLQTVKKRYDKFLSSQED